MIVGASVYVVYLAQLLLLRDDILYAASALLGLGAALLWTGQVNLNLFYAASAHLGLGAALIWTGQVNLTCSTQLLPSWDWEQR